MWNLYAYKLVRENKLWNKFVAPKAEKMGRDILKKVSELAKPLYLYTSLEDILAR